DFRTNMSALLHAGACGRPEPWHPLIAFEVVWPGCGTLPTSLASSRYVFVRPPGSKTDLRDQQRIAPPPDHCACNKSIYAAFENTWPRRPDHGPSLQLVPEGDLEDQMHQGRRRGLFHPLLRPRHGLLRAVSTS